MIILIGSQKGGPGKTTIAVNLSVEFARRGSSVCLLDADSQRSASRWHEDRTEAGHKPVIALVENLGNIFHTANALDEQYDVVIIDVAGKDSKEMRTGMTAADILVVVSRASQLDLDTLSHVDEIVGQARDFNPDLRAFTLINQALPNPSVTEIDDAASIVGDYPALPLLKTVVHSRKAYRDVIGEGLGVVEWNNAAAKVEIKRLAEELMN